MSTKSRQVIWGGRIMGAQIRAQGAREAAKKAAREADRAGLRMEVLAGERVTGAEIARARVGRRSRKCTKATAESRAPIKERGSGRPASPWRSRPGRGSITYFVTP